MAKDDRVRWRSEGATGNRRRGMRPIQVLAGKGASPEKAVRSEVSRQVQLYIPPNAFASFTVNGGRRALSLRVLFLDGGGNFAVGNLREDALDRLPPGQVVPYPSSAEPAIWSGVEETPAKSAGLTRIIRISARGDPNSSGERIRINLNSAFSHGFRRTFSESEPPSQMKTAARPMTRTRPESEQTC